MRRNRSWIIAGVLTVIAAVPLAQTPPASPAEAEASKLLGAAQTAWHKKQFPDALAKLAQIQDTYATTAAAPQAGLWMGHVMVALGDPIAAMEEFQQVRTRWPKNAAAADALACASILRRLYARPAGTPAYGSPEKGGEKLDNILGLAATARNAVYRSGEKSVDAVQRAEGDVPPTGPFGKPRLTLDNAGNLVVVENNRLVLPAPARPLTFRFGRQGKPPQALEKIEAAVQLSTGDWLVMDADEKQIVRFSSEGTNGQVFEAAPGKGGAVRATRLAVNAFDEVAALDADAPRVVLFDASGAVKGTIAYKRRGADAQESFELKDPKDLEFDDFGHLYVLDQKQLAIFTPYAAAPAKPGPARTGAPDENWGDDYRLRTLFAETPEKGREGFKATVFTVDRSGAVFLYDENLKQILVYR